MGYHRGHHGSREGLWGSHIFVFPVCEPREMIGLLTEVSVMETRSEPEQRV